MFSQQPFEIPEVILHPDFIEMVEFLQKDEVYNWRFIDSNITKQHRSLSMDQAQSFFEEE